MSSIYHPFDLDDKISSNDELSLFYELIITNTEMISGQDMNANIGIRLPIYLDAIGPHGILNYNINGKHLLNLLKSIKMIVANSWFPQKNYTTWRSFSEKKSEHVRRMYLL